MNISEKSEKIFSKAQRGSADSFVGGIQKGVPPIIRCGGIAGEIQELSLHVTDKDGTSFQMHGLELLGDDSTMFLIDRSKGIVRFSLIIDGNEVTSEDQDGSYGWLRVIAVQRLGVPFAILAEWDQRIGQAEAINTLLSGSDSAFVQHAYGLIRLERE